VTGWRHHGRNCQWDGLEGRSIAAIQGFYAQTVIGVLSRIHLAFDGWRK
jgi:hypothetical protein